MQKAIKRKDGRGTMKILPSRDAAGAHGKTATLVGFDEIHAFRDWDLLEALQPDPLRWDAQIWITSYDTVYNHAWHAALRPESDRHGRHRPAHAVQLVLGRTLH